MCFSSNNIGLDIDLSNLGCSDSSKLIFSENSGIIIQSNKDLEKEFSSIDVKCFRIGNTNNKGVLNIKNFENNFSFNINKYRDIWYSTSKDFDLKQTKNNKAIERFNNYKNQPLEYIFPDGFNGNNTSDNSNKKIKAAIIREKGSNSEREMAYMISLAGFDVKDIHMTDIISGEENLEDINLLVAVGGFSNSDVLGSAKGWAGSFLHNPIAKNSINKFFERDDTMSLRDAKCLIACLR